MAKLKGSGQVKLVEEHRREKREVFARIVGRWVRDVLWS